MLSIHPPVHYNHRDLLVLMVSKGVQATNAAVQGRQWLQEIASGSFMLFMGGAQDIPMEKTAPSKAGLPLAIAPNRADALAEFFVDAHTVTAPLGDGILTHAHSVSTIGDRGAEKKAKSKSTGAQPIARQLDNSRSNATQIGDVAPQPLVISNTCNGLPQVSQGTVPPVETKAAVYPVTFKPNEENPQLVLAPSSVASTSQYESPAGAHIAAAQGSDGAHYPSLCASHGTAKGHAPLVTENIHCQLLKPIPCHPKKQSLLQPSYNCQRYQQIRPIFSIVVS
ncbi:hypothetical protein F0562_032277 [Nyssa sinensis]|uniref:Uncharacterized protein n=1 Tax=Nyssa sinensis TaxID=561372 RepID=A0A5J5APL3_9ASTE|nr:hypothetical protein F0562_032277 [Nyssa sinensis]